MGGCTLGQRPLLDDLESRDKDGEDLKHEDGEMDPEVVSSVLNLMSYLTTGKVLTIDSERNTC